MPGLLEIWGSGSSLSWTTIDLFWRMDNIQMAAGDCYDTDSLWAGTGTPSITEGCGSISGNGQLVDGSAEYYTLDDTTPLAGYGTSGRIGIWIDNNSGPTAQLDFIRIYDDASNLVIFSVLATGEARMSWRGEASWEMYLNSTGAALSSTPKFIEFAWDAGIGDGSDYAEIFVNGASVASISNETLTTFTPVQVTTGATTSGGGENLCLENFIMSSDKTLDLYNSGAGHAHETSCP